MNHRNKKAIFIASLPAVAAIIFLFLIEPALSTKAAGSACQSNGTGGGNFDNPATWTNCNATTPQGVDSITILNGDTVTLVDATAVTGITIDDGGILDANTQIIHDLGDYTNNGSHTGTTSAMNLDAITTAVISGGGVYLPTGEVTIASGDKTIAQDSHLSFPTINVKSTTLTNDSTDGFSVTTSLVGNGTFLQYKNSVLNLGGTSTVATLNASASLNEVHYNSTTNNQAVRVVTYYHLFIENPHFTATLGAGTTTVLGNLEVLSGTLDLDAGTLAVTGTTDIYGTLRDQNKLGSATFESLVTVQPGGFWIGLAGQACDFTFHNGLTFDGAGFTSGSGTYEFSGSDQSITGSSSMSIDHILVTGIALTNSAPLTVTQTLSGSGQIIQDAGAVLTLGGASGITTLTASASGNTVYYNGAAAQIIHEGQYQTLDVSGNSGGLSMGGNATVGSSLVLGASKVPTGSYKMILASAAGVSRTSGYIIGILEKNITAGGSFTFTIGDAVRYAPASITLSGFSAGGSIDGSVTNSDHTNIASSGINSAKSVNRYWTLVNNGVSFTNYNATFTFAGADVDSGATVANMLVAKKSAGIWTLLPASCAGTACSVTGLTAMSDFQIGEASDQTPPTISSIDSDAQTFTNATTSPRTIKITFGEDVSNTPTISVGPNGGAQTVNDCGDGNAKTFCFSYTIPPATSATETITVSNAQDASFNTMVSNSAHTFLIDTIVPAVPPASSTVSGGGGGGTGGVPLLSNVQSVPPAPQAIPSLPSAGQSAPSSTGTFVLPPASRPASAVVAAPTGTFVLPGNGAPVAVPTGTFVLPENGAPVVRPPLFDIASQPAAPPSQNLGIMLVVGGILALFLMLWALFSIAKRRFQKRNAVKLIQDIQNGT